MESEQLCVIDPDWASQWQLTGANQPPGEHVCFLSSPWRSGLCHCPLWDPICPGQCVDEKTSIKDVQSVLVLLQIKSVTQSCPTLCDPMNHSTPGLPVHHHLLEFNETHVHWVSDVIQPSRPLSSPPPPAPNPSQHHSLFQRVNSSHEVAKVLEFQL